MATYAIGDIQGCYNELRQLLEKIRFSADRDELWFTGDLVNRGPDSLRTLEYLYSMRDNIITVLGNHDLHLLATAYHHRKPGKKDTLDELLDSPNSDRLLDWLRHRPLLHHDPELGACMVHAAIHPAWTLVDAKHYAGEVETVLQSEDHIVYYQHMYGDKPTYWSEDLEGWARIRYLTNIFTRLRFMDRKRISALQAKGPPEYDNDSLIPWFDLEDRATSEERIIFGHWSTLILVEREYHNVYPIDTGCLWGGKLTALRIDVEPFETTSVGCVASQPPGQFE